MTIIVSGTIGRSGIGGQVWTWLQSLLGLRALGHDVYPAFAQRLEAEVVRK